MESELFWSTPRGGPLTGASENTLGRVSQADGATLFLDEIGDFPRWLLGSPSCCDYSGQGVRTRWRSVTRHRRCADSRCPNRSLKDMVEEGRFSARIWYLSL